MRVRVGIRLLGGNTQIENINVNGIIGFLGVKMAGNDGVDGGIGDGKER